MTNAEKALEMHEKWQGKLEIVSKAKVNSKEDLAVCYTPGVAEPCKLIAKDKSLAYKYTIKSNTIAVVSDGSAVLGLGNIGPHAAMPVMEGKAVLFKEFGGVNAVPICLDTQDTEEIIKAVTYLAPGFAERNTASVEVLISEGNSVYPLVDSDGILLESLTIGSAAESDAFLKLTGA